MAHTETRKSRVLVAAAGVLLGLVTLWLRIAWLQIGMHGYYADRAERNQEQRVLIKPVRGDLLDRHGRTLASDLLTYSLAAAPREMADPSGTAHQLAKLLKLNARKLERAFVARPRYLTIARRVTPDLAEALLDRNRRGLYLATETRRQSLLDPAASEIVGHTDVDNRGVDGLELELDEDLGGRPGWITMIRDGRGGEHSLPRGLRRAATDGSSVTLTLDADLQGILESHLARAVDTLNAVRGFAVFLDPSTGEILAAASVPHLPPGQARNWPFTDQFEPGSTFKAVVAGAALEENVARPDQYFDAGNGVCQVAPGAIFHDTHKRPGFTFKDAVRFSSNIVMAKLAVLIGPDRLYRYATSLGFGSLTGVRFPGETAGRLHSPEHWSARSCPTIGIGHEVTVTPLQLALAYAAIANGGVLMQPMLVREVRDARGNLVRRMVPHASHRVFSEATTATLRGMLQAVVDSGTARPARIADFPIAGKTGTAQKYDASVGTYGRGMYLSSFVGFAPADQPSLVGVIVIDEPRGKHYYGGEVAAPVFREVVQDLRRLPHGPFDFSSTQWAARPPRPAPVTVPDLHLLPPRDAERRLAEAGLRAHFEGDGARALSQLPAAGEAVERGASVSVWLSAPADSLGRRMPDLIGLAVREALRRLTLLEVSPHIQCHGLVARQSPAPGATLARGDRCDLWCESNAVALVNGGPGGPGGIAGVAASGPAAPAGSDR
ncbi:MAG: PASTA domain-containing protein, partial [Candidatus Eisenbacteria bacterium]|nr:PASTA domain-containing protein [Candidatus Eisenbacteria bacterium]